LKTQSIQHGAYTNTANYEYNALNQNTKVIDQGTSYDFDYDEFGNVGLSIAGNGTGATFQYDPAQQLEALSIATANATPILTERYEYDANGNRTKFTRRVGSSATEEEVRYTYDTINQLTSETLPGNIVKTYTYD
jgi:uncharacterized protein RhaS with RHS repeats